MRVLFTVPWGHRLGGAETMLQAVLDGALESGHEVELVFLHDGPWPQEVRAMGLRVDVLEAGRLREPWRMAQAVLALARILRERRPDLLINWAAKTQLYGAPAAVLAGMGARVVWWQHMIPTRNWLDSLAAALPTRAVGCSSQAGARAQRRIVPRRRTFVVNPGAEAPAVSAGPPALELPGDVPVVGIVGRLQPWKGQDRLLRAQAILRGRGMPIHLVVVGGDSGGFSTEYAASLQPLISELGLTGSVTMTGEVPDAGPYVERMDVLVNASDPEPFGIVILEAMARGVPVVAVNSGGPAEFLEHGATGILAGSGEPEALADALEPLVASAEERGRLGAAARARFLGHHTNQVMRTRLFAALEELLVGLPSRERG
jgi:glycosyltransferase involved in cell wall biosynthesis